MVDAASEGILFDVAEASFEDAEIELLLGEVHLEERVEPVERSPQREPFDRAPVAICGVSAIRGELIDETAHLGVLLAHRHHRVAAVHEPLELVVERRLDRIHVRQQLTDDEPVLVLEQRMQRRAIDLTDHLREDEETVDVRHELRVVVFAGCAEREHESTLTSARGMIAGPILRLRAPRRVLLVVDVIPRWQICLAPALVPPACVARRRRFSASRSKALYDDLRRDSGERLAFLFSLAREVQRRPAGILVTPDGVTIQRDRERRQLELGKLATISAALSPLVGRIGANADDHFAVAYPATIGREAGGVIRMLRTVWANDPATSAEWLPQRPSGSA